MSTYSGSTAQLAVVKEGERRIEVKWAAHVPCSVGARRGRSDQQDNQYSQDRCQNRTALFFFALPFLGLEPMAWVW